MTESDKKIEFISLQDASREGPYSQEYLSLLARRGKIFAKKIGRNWYTTREALDDYLKKQSLVITLPRNILQKDFSTKQKARMLLTNAITSEEPEVDDSHRFGKIGVGHEDHSRAFEEFERLNPQIFQHSLKIEKASESKIAEVPQISGVKIVPITKEFGTDNQNKIYRSETTSISNNTESIILPQVIEKLDRLSNSIETFSEKASH